MNTDEPDNCELLFVTFLFVVLQSGCKMLPYWKGIFLHSFYTAVKAYRINRAFWIKPSVMKPEYFSYVCITGEPSQAQSIVTAFKIHSLLAYISSFSIWNPRKTNVTTVSERLKRKPLRFCTGTSKSLYNMNIHWKRKKNS